MKMTPKEKVLALHEAFPTASFARLSRITGRERHLVAWDIQGGRPEHHKVRYRKWQKDRNIEAKRKLIEALGGKCAECGYDKCADALEFHHKDPTKKEYPISDLLLGRFDKALEEAKKRILLCCRCHREFHALGEVSGGAGGIRLPI